MDASFYDTFWWAKLLVYVALLIGFCFLDSDVFDARGYAWWARIGGFLFIILQQIILLDMAYIWNERWVDMSTREDSNSLYLTGLLSFSAILFMGSYAAIGIMFWQFDCPDAAAIISLTLILTFFATVIQLFGEHGSLLTSAIVTAYATYVCFSAVTKNPNSECNPTLGGGSQTASIVIGVLLSILSLSWTTLTTVKRVRELSADEAAPNSSETDSKRLEAAPTQTTAEPSKKSYSTTFTKEVKSLLVNCALVFLLLSSYFAMILTNWATEQKDGSSASTSRGDVSMWLQATAIWLAVLLYIWSLLAPVLLPGRDFGPY